MRFLDFDGVLSPTTEPDADDTVVHTPLFGWLPVLVALLRPHPAVAIVVHSTWRYTHDVDELKGVLGPLGGRVLGAVPHGPRHDSILEWLRLNPQVTSYRILDDALSEFPSPLPAELIVCDPSAGVSASAVQARIRAWLDEEPASASCTARTPQPSSGG